jgi:hypothetical protein
MKNYNNVSYKECKVIENLIWKQYVDKNDNCEPIIDGIVHLKLFNNSKYKILWILKEPYDDQIDGVASGGGWHFNKFLYPDNFYTRMGRSRNTWHPIIYVCYGILNELWEYNWMDWIRDDRSMAEIVREIAVINVKKLPGLTRTNDYSRITDAYALHKNILLKQIEVYNPDIIIGGFTLPLFYNDLGITGELIKNNGSVDYAILNSKIFIDAYHPGQSEVTRDTYVNDILSAVRTWSEFKK